MIKTPFMRNKIPVCQPSSVRMMKIARAGSSGRRKRSVCMVESSQVPDDLASRRLSSQHDHLRLDLSIQGHSRRESVLRWRRDREKRAHQFRVELLDIDHAQDVIADGIKPVQEHAVQEVEYLEPRRAT